jgi:hypothetical protein
MWHFPSSPYSVARAIILFMFFFYFNNHIRRKKIHIFLEWKTKIQHYPTHYQFIYPSHTHPIFNNQI